jgi:hypothetical protein
MNKTEQTSDTPQTGISSLGATRNSSIIESQLCPKCREKGSLKYKRYLMFSRVCKNDGTYVKLPTHPDYGK